jgi:acetyl-CoA acetyltransferase family protein
MDVGEVAAKRGLVLLDGVRTPMAEFNRSFADLSAIELGALAAGALFERSGVSPKEIEHCVVGNAMQTSTDAMFGARHVALRSGVPKEVPALTVNRLCGSGIQSIVSGAHLIMTGEATTCLVGGMENMSQAPHCIWGARRGFALGQGKMQDLLMASLLDPYCGNWMAGTSNNLARDYAISREEQDAFAVRSQKLARDGWESGRLAEEVTPIEVGRGRRRRIVSRDEHPRPGTDMDALSRLKTVFEEDGFVTAGNASGIVDGAAMMILTTAQSAAERGVRPLGRIVAWATVGVEPSRMGIGPAPAIDGALGRAGMKLDDVDLFEINEAFAGQLLAVVRELELDLERVNVNGGAIALGHPLGATGTRLVLTVLKELGRRGGGIGVASACIGGGQGIAIVVEALG